jgi:hypothetical protein
MITLWSTPACASLMTCASGLEGKILGGGVTLGGGTVATLAAVGAGGAGCAWAFENCAEESLASQRTASAIPAVDFLTKLVFIIGQFFNLDC